MKAVAVLLTALLATQMVGTPAFASLEQSEKAANEQIATEVKDVAADEPAETPATETETPKTTESDKPVEESAKAKEEAEIDASNTQSAANSESNSAGAEKPAASDQQVEPDESEIADSTEDAALNEVESASPAAVPMMLSIKAVDWDSFGAAVSLYDENMQFVASSSDQNVAGGAIADNVVSQIEVNGALYDFIGAYVGDN